MNEPETLAEAVALIAVLKKQAEHFRDQRDEARGYANGLLPGFAKRADALKVVMRQAKRALMVLEAFVPVVPAHREALELAASAIEALDKALTR